MNNKEGDIVVEDFIVAEVGSTVTKVYKYINGETVTNPSKTIGFSET